MNFLMRAAHPTISDLPTVHEVSTYLPSLPQTATTLEGLIAEDPFPESSTNDDGGAANNGGGILNESGPASSENNCGPVGGHSDVAEDEGWITIPYKPLPENWSDATDILSFHPLDRSFIFPGEQLHILVCLSAPKQDTEIITPFRVAAVMSKNGILEQNSEQRAEVMPTDSDSVMESVDLNSGHHTPAGENFEASGETTSSVDKIDIKKDISASETLLRMEDHKKQIETLLEKFKNSHFFVRIADSDEPLWSKKSVPECSLDSDAVGGNISKSDIRTDKVSGKGSHINAVVDRGDFNGNASGGMARDSVRCCSLRNGDIVVLLQVNVGVNFLKDPVLEVLQFEKYQPSNQTSENCDNMVGTNIEDPCRELLKWLLPLDRSLSPPPRSLSPPPSLSSTSLKATFSSSSGSQLFSFGNFRSHSMSSLPQAAITPSPVVPSSISKPSFDLEDWDHFPSHKPGKSQEKGPEGLLSFRGVSLEPERFSVHCGLEGIYIPGRRWRRKLEIVQPVEIHSFAADCNTEDLLCVQIKNVSPAQIPDIVVFIDAITIVFEKAPKGGAPLFLPIACIEAGNDHSLPNLALRRGEEHSFIIKPAALMGKHLKPFGERSSHLSQVAGAPPNLPPISRICEGTSSTANQYAVLVSCRCNYTESKLFFKKTTSWRPRATRDLMISVASEMSKQTVAPTGGISQLPVQVLTLQASNLTSEDLTLTILAPASSMSPPSVVSLNSSPSTPMSPFIGFSDFTARLSGERRSTSVQRLSSLPILKESQIENGSPAERSVSAIEDAGSSSDVIPSTGLGCTHLWLQSTVPLGCVPSKSMATVKIELLPLTDGIITLDTLQIAVREKGLTYVPELSLKIHATSSIATGIV